MAHPNPNQIPPDYEDTHRLAHALCQHLGLNPEHVELGSMQIELGPDARHRITWTGHTHLNLDNLAGLIHKAHHPNDTDPPRCVAVSSARAERCMLTLGHIGRHRYP